MYSKQLHSNTSTNLPDVRVAVDKGSLRLQFSTKVSQSFYKKHQAYKGLGRSDIEKLKWHVDGDTLPKYGEAARSWGFPPKVTAEPRSGEKPIGWKFSGKRVKRGLFRTAINWYSQYA